MARFDRYVLSQLLLLFGFFALVLVTIFWINSAAKLFDKLIADGQSAGIVVQYTLLTLPRVVGMILPIAAFASAVYMANRQAGDSELVVLRATGMSPWRLMRPVLFFGLMVGAAAAVIAHLLLPMSQSELAERQRALTRDVTARLLSEGTFLHPTDGVTFYIREIGADGTLNDIFLADRRAAGRADTFTARRAYLINAAENDDDPARPTLVMLDGMAQSLNLESDRLVTTRFDDFSYDLTQLIGDVTMIEQRAAFLPTGALLRRTEEIARRTGESPGEILAEGHGRLRDSGIALAAAAIGFAAMLAGGFNRFGAWRQIGLAVLCLVLVKMVENVTVGAVAEAPRLWPVIYLPVLLGLAIAVALLLWAGRMRRIPSGPPAMEAAA
ncbi:MAG: LPS export ABC transporter permease LptF [Pseudooceanicola sp.]